MIMSVIGAGIIYFAVVFAAGFAFGVVRALVLLPHLGAFVSVAVELPGLLAVAWITARTVARHWHVREAFGVRLIMGGVAFALLMMAELALSVVVFGRTWAAHAMLYREPAHILGLAGQIAFALFPAIQANCARR